MCMSPKDGDMDLGVLLPKEINGWSVTEEDRLFDPETIFDYINGAGEVYRAFNFKSLLAFKKDLCHSSHVSCILSLSSVESIKRFQSFFL